MNNLNQRLHKRASHQVKHANHQYEFTEEVLGVTTVAEKSHNNYGNDHNGVIDTFTSVNTFV